MCGTGKKGDHIMAKLTKKQEKQYETVLKLMHEMIQTKFSNSRSEYEEVISKIREAVAEDDK